MALVYPSTQFKPVQAIVFASGDRLCHFQVKLAYSGLFCPYLAC